MEDEKLPFDPDKELRSDQWDKLSLNDLWLQKILLQKRIDACRQLRNVGMQKQLERGMAFLQARIEEQGKKEDVKSSIFL